VGCCGLETCKHMILFCFTAGHLTMIRVFFYSMELRPRIRVRSARGGLVVAVLVIDMNLYGLAIANQGQANGSLLRHQ